MGGIGLRKVQEYRIVIVEINRRLGMKVHMIINNFYENSFKDVLVLLPGARSYPTSVLGAPGLLLAAATEVATGSGYAGETLLTSAW